MKKMIKIKYNFNGEIFEYECDYTLQDICDYLIPPKVHFATGEKIAYIEGMKKVINNFGLNKDMVEEDEYFAEYLKKRYEEIARESFENDL